MTKRLILMIIVAFVCTLNVDAQGWLGRLKDRATEAAKRSVEYKVESKVDRTVDDAMDDVLDGKSDKKSKKSNDSDYEDEEVEEGPQDTEAVYEQTDFVPGTSVFFEDNLQGEQMGEFPSKWDLIDGSTDVANMKGKKCIHFEPSTRIEPLMTNQTSYLPDFFTLECDFWMNDP